MWLPTLIPAKALPTPAYCVELVPYRAAAALSAAVRAAGVGGARRHVRRERLVPDLQGCGPADARDGDAVRGRAVVGHSVDGLGAAALGEQVEHVVRRARGVVDVQVADARVPAVCGGAVLVGLVHVAQRCAVTVDVDFLADEVVADVGAVGGVELHARAEDVGGRLVEAAGLSGVVEVRGVGGDAVGHLVVSDVERGEGLGAALAVAVRHAEAGIVPEGVDVRGAVVDARVGGDAVVLDAAAAEDVLVEVPGRLGAEVGVDMRRSGCWSRSRCPTRRRRRSSGCRCRTCRC